MPESPSANIQPSLQQIKAELRIRAENLRCEFERTGDASALLRQQRILVDHVLKSAWIFIKIVSKSSLSVKINA